MVKFTKRPIRYHQEKNRKKVYHILHWLAIFVLFAFSISLTTINSRYFRATLLQAPIPEPFDGTSSPIQKTPDWVKSSSDERKMAYRDFPQYQLVPLPSYDQQVLEVDTSGLSWKDEKANAVRNTQITYSVVYAGNYNLDGIEGGGSHPAVDIKALYGTPVYSIANGIVDKISYYSSGFGLYVVIKHPNVPSPDNEKIKMTIYSGYAHLSDIFVTEGELVKRGQKIGEVGDSGIATTDHLHFQIDSDNAPWHLYWPFTSSQASNSGLSFFEAVNAGLGMENVYKYTINPLIYVQTYSADSVNLYESPAAKVKERLKEEKEEVEEIEKIEETENPPKPVIETKKFVDPVVKTVEKELAQVNFDRFEISFFEEFILKGNSVRVDVKTLNKNGSIQENPDFKDKSARLEVLPTLGRLDKNVLYDKDFKNGKATLYLQSNMRGRAKIKIEFNSQEYFSSELNIIEEVKPIVKFGILHDGNFVPGVAETLTVLLLDPDGKRTPKQLGAVEILIQVKDGGRALFDPHSLKTSDFKYGKAEVRFTAHENVPYIIEAEGANLSGVSKEIQPSGDLVFKDVPEGAPYSESIAYLKEKDLISGYPDGTFRPDQGVSRVESLKFIFNALNYEVSDTVALPFPDTYDDQWYFPYLATAFSEGIVKGYPDGTFHPDNQVTLVEFLKIMIKSLKIDVDVLVKENPCKDAHRFEWFAHYVQFAVQNKLVEQEDSEGMCYPSKVLSRGEVADIMARMIEMKEAE